MEKNYSGSIALTKLKSVIIEKKGKDGNLVKGLFIPIELNGLELKDGSVYMPFKIIAKSEQDKYGQNGFITKNSKPPKPYKELSDDEKTAHNASNPILGSIKDFTSSTNTAAATTIENDDDLPF